MNVALPFEGLEESLGFAVNLEDLDCPVAGACG